MRAREYDVLVRAVEEGAAYGWDRAHKHSDAPTDQQIKAAIEQAVLDTICEWFDFEDRLDERV